MYQRSVEKQKYLVRQTWNFILYFPVYFTKKEITMKTLMISERGNVMLVEALNGYKADSKKDLAT